MTGRGALLDGCGCSIAMAACHDMAREKRHYGKLLTDLLHFPLGNLCTLPVSKEATSPMHQSYTHKKPCPSERATPVHTEFSNVLNHTSAQLLLTTLCRLVMITTST